MAVSYHTAGRDAKFGGELNRMFVWTFHLGTPKADAALDGHYEVKPVHIAIVSKTAD
jgi:hypothetical protein